MNLQFNDKRLRFEEVYPRAPYAVLIPLAIALAAQLRRSIDERPRRHLRLRGAAPAPLPQSVAAPEAPARWR